MQIGQVRKRNELEEELERLQREGYDMECTHLLLSPTTTNITITHTIVHSDSMRTHISPFPSSTLIHIFNSFQLSYSPHLFNPSPPPSALID